jgi:hypothetical protein
LKAVMVMPQDDEVRNDTRKKPEKPRTREAPVPQTGEVEVPAEPNVPDVQPREIHRRRWLPTVPQKPDDPEPGSDKSP